jgi:hypothetical protein
MLSLLKTTWSKYWKLVWWKKLLLAIPLIVLAICCGCLFFMSAGGGGKKFEDEVKHHKNYVDEQIKAGLQASRLLEEEEKKLRAEQDAIAEEIKDNDAEVLETVSRIDSAVNDNDLAELERIREQLNSRSRKRGRS